MTKRHQCNIDCGLSESGCTVVSKYEGVFAGPPLVEPSVTITAHTNGYVQVISPRGKNNYRVEYRLGDDVKTIWVDADSYGFDDHGAVCTFYVVNIGDVFSATHVYSVTWVKDNAAPSPAPYFPPFPTPAPWAPSPPFMPPYRIGDFPPFPGTITGVGQRTRRTSCQFEQV
jgi:hypothetical protein